MNERPIIFSGPMVQAILAGRKTQTRRIVRHYGISSVRRVSGPCSKLGDFDFIFPHENDPSKDGVGHMVACPYGIPGDRLWVRESFCIGYPAGEPGHWTAIPYSGCAAERRAFYRADGGDPPDEPQRYWKPSIHMPRWASRITLEITGVRVERLQEISAADVLSEGIERADQRTSDVTIIGQYQSLWDSLNAKRAPWEANPWVWALEFRRLPE